MRAGSEHGLSPMLRQSIFEEAIPEDRPLGSKREREAENNEVDKLDRRIAKLENALETKEAARKRLDLELGRARARITHAEVGSGLAI